MHILANNTQLEITFDPRGNVFFTLNDKTYYLDIDRNDNLILYQVNNYETNEQNVKTGKIERVIQPNTLKGKIIGDIIENMNDEITLDDDGDEAIMNVKMFPESVYYTTKPIEDNDSIDGDLPDTHMTDLTKFRFYGNIPFGKHSFETLSIFNTIVIEGNIDSDNVICESEMYNDTASYRITIYTHGVFRLNIIGTKFKRFNLTIIDDVPMLVF